MRIFRYIMLAVAIFLAILSIVRSMPLIQNYQTLDEFERGQLMGNGFMFVITLALAFIYYKRIKENR
jgi:hypothetical protein